MATTKVACPQEQACLNETQRCWLCCAGCSGRPQCHRVLAAVLGQGWLLDRQCQPETSGHWHHAQGECLPTTGMLAASLLLLICNIVHSHMCLWCSQRVQSSVTLEERNVCSSLIKGCLMAQAAMPCSLFACTLNWFQQKPTSTWAMTI